MSNGFSRLAEAIRGTGSKEQPSSIDLATIGQSGELLLDQFSIPLPKSEYLIAEWMVDAHIPQDSRIYRTASPVNPDGTDIPGVTSYSQSSRLDFGAGSDNGHIPKAKLQMGSALQPGDRVLVIWVRNEPVIISKVVPGDA
ncbi:peptide methionine sulfoxide reductase [Paenibacillus sp. NPDC057967]|uniref:peptide methionine sulfoxide reductase n=1 Tax=Paenibacillus sp. NPDC057967 TaxID=3346293 RepID=UPI0036D9F1D8